MGRKGSLSSSQRITGRKEQSRRQGEQESRKRSREQAEEEEKASKGMWPAEQADERAER